MTDLPPYPGAPRWVKVSAIIGGILVLLFAAMMVFGVGGPHGPGRHMPSGSAGGGTPPSSATGGGLDGNRASPSASP